MVFDVTNRLEFDKVKARLTDFALSYLGKNLVKQMVPLTDKRVIERLLEETEEAVCIIQFGASIPIPALDGMEQLVAGFGKGILLSIEELQLIGRLLEATEQLKRFMAKKESVAPNVSAYAQSMHDLTELKREIERCIRHGQVTDQASPELSKIRKKMVIIEERIKKKLDGTMQKYRSYLQEYVVSMRGDRYVVPVKKEHRKLIPGTVLDESASGQTVFIEPADLAQLSFELNGWRADEAAEEMKIIAYLTDLTESYRYEIAINLETIGHYDFLTAKAKYARSLDGRTVRLNTEGIIRIAGGKHPLLGNHSVPLQFEIGNGYRALIITGPNTGGKTVALKTIGLLTMMVQSGLLVPVDEGSDFAIYSDVSADIGDGQSLEHSLSTFSSHIKNVIRILHTAGPSSLILLDELATGTDPGEGIGLSIAVLEELYKCGATVIATTHYNEIKRFAEEAPGFQNASMAFDLETLQPLYKLTIGAAGSSYAFQIALKLGVPNHIIERSKAITYSRHQGDPLVSMEAALAEHRMATDAVPVWSEAVSAGDKPDSSGITSGSTEKEAAKDRQAASQKREASLPVLELGDCVWVHSLRRTGIVCSQPDERGNIVVMIQKEKVKINRKRLSLYIEKKQLYPDESYDMDIVFESKDTRKKRKQMNKRHDPGNFIITPAEDK
ncbi:Endonuclease MutS2 [Paenibacillus solanacearum]|uniref:Endonuclease MutS2 n=1 Tax=Paenibacillus solanacearum TaxID=2048548 RepID=A0A916JVL4_9BACL|nr:DNA mismatch repair protein MutS [Paenibacillus solanacearum]CAG7602021.1 Endonuclease MutS2 [Paenibacillus solanacearum]